MCKSLIHEISASVQNHSCMKFFNDLFGWNNSVGVGLLAFSGLSVFFFGDGVFLPFFIFVWIYLMVRIKMMNS